MLAAAIVLVTVLYLVDKNQKWGTVWKITKWSACVGVTVIAFYLYDYYKDEQRVTCAEKVRAIYPSSYKDLADVVLGEKVLAKYPTCDVAKWIGETVPPFASDVVLDFSKAQPISSSELAPKTPAVTAPSPRQAPE